MRICDLGNKYRLKVATAPSGVPEALFLSSNQSRNPAQIYSAIWTPMDNETSICALLNG